MYTVETTVSFEAAHRLYDVDTYAAECRENIHGHSYKVRIVVGSSKLNTAKMVIDFKLLKKIVKETIEDHYDHACILKWDDPLVQPIMDNCRKVIVVNDNPTAEYMAETFFNELSDRFDRDDLDVPVSVISVSVQETEHNIATYTKGFVM